MYLRAQLGQTAFMTKGTSPIALCAALPVPTGEANAAPDWVHLLPAGEIRTVDGRGPYLVKSLQAIAEALKPGEKLPIDENHAIDRAGSLGQPSPARGWIVELQARDDGLWGRVEWTPEGKVLIEGQAYRGISPAILHDAKKNVLGVLRASLVNNPNLKGLTALHSEEETAMDYKAKLLGLLGLGSDADDAAIEAALSAKKDDKPALHSVIETPEYLALQAQHTEMATELKTLKDDRLRDRATAFVDAAIAEGRAGLNATVRDQYITLHMENPERAEQLIGAMPKLSGATRAADPAQSADDKGLTAADRSVMALMGLSEEEYAASLKATGKQMETL